MKIAVLLAVLPCAAEAQTRLRLMAADITSGTNQSYDLGHGIRIFQGLEPDIVMIQELNYGTNSAADIRTFVDTAFGSQFEYFRESDAQVPTGIVSKYPILSSGEWDDTQTTSRDYSWAQIDIPGSRDLWCVSVHFLATSASVRNTQATSLRTFIQNAVPTGDYLAIGGNINSDNRSEALFTTLSTVVAPGGPHPADQNSNANTNSNRNKPYDHVLVNSGLKALQTSVVIGASTFANGLVFDSRVYTTISEVAPVIASDSDSSNMQHMAVVKDFLLPSATPTATPMPTATASPTATETPTPTASPSPSATPTATPVVPASDTDRDGLDDGTETWLGTNPSSRDTDSDGLEDGIEVAMGTDPLDANDPPMKTDTDGDGIPDQFDNAPNSIDSDNDGYKDGYEMAVGSDPADGESTPDLGDANDDGNTDVADVVAILSVFLGSPASFVDSRYLDVNRDGAVDNVDGVILFNWYLGNIPYIPF